MKTFVIANNYSPVKTPFNLGWYFLTDSAISNTGKPFYLPENLGKTSVHLGLAIRFSRLGKGILPEFASRYYSEYAPVLHFTLPEYADRLKENGLPEDAARSFDRSLIVGEFKEKNSFEILTLKMNGESKSIFDIEKLNLNVDDIIFSVSRMNTIKIGDLIIPGLNGNFEIKEGDFLEVFQGEERSFYVKVK